MLLHPQDGIALDLLKEYGHVLSVGVGFPMETTVVVSHVADEALEQKYSESSYDESVLRLTSAGAALIGPYSRGLHKKTLVFDHHPTRPGDMTQNATLALIGSLASIVAPPTAG